MNGPDEKNKSEILIIRRSSGEEGAGHKGGAWKIAYADFVTAMMAFFLVMWLINSANEATRARVASYFNPIKMTDATPGGKGLKDLSNTKKAENNLKTEGNAEKSGDTSETKGAAKQDKPNLAEAMLAQNPLLNPYKVIEEVEVAQASKSQNGGSNEFSSKLGDPFDPKAWAALKDSKNSIAQASTDRGAPETKITSDRRSALENSIEVSGKPETNSHSGSRPVQQIRLEALAESINAKIADAVKRAGAQANIGASVKLTPEGLLIVLSDRSSQAMFDSGSAKPSPAILPVISAVGKILAAEEGKIIVRGHTDAFQFKDLSFDNWQLSTARAHMASYMLFRAGVDNQRLARIEGYGASDPANIADPLADENRRVEFLLQE